jgi:aspartate carbamoyltransferase catalytic subunit
VRVFNRLDDAIDFADALNMLRIQHERQNRGFFPSVGEYSRYFGLNRFRTERITKDLLVLHPGPINRGVEIDSETADGERSVILAQVENGVAIRMAVLATLLQ